MTDKKIEEVVKKMLQQAGTPDPNILKPDGRPVNEPDEIQILTVVVQNLEMGFMQLAQSQESIGISLDAARLTIQMLVNLIIEKGLVSKEEMQERYKKDVGEKIREHQKKRQEEIQKQIEEAKAEAEQAQKEIIDEKPEKETEEVPNGSAEIMLPSEKHGKVITFPTNKKEGHDK